MIAVEQALARGWAVEPDDTFRRDGWALVRDGFALSVYRVDLPALRTAERMLRERRAGADTPERFFSRERFGP